MDALVISDGTTFFGGDDTVVTCPVTLYGTIDGGDFRQAEVTVDENATIHRGKFAILERDTNGGVMVTGAIDLDNMGENEAQLWDIMSSSMGELTIAGQASFDAGDDPLSVPAITNWGKLTGGTFESNSIQNYGEITSGTFGESVGNFSSITGGTFNGTVTNLETGSVIHGGTFLYRITGIGAIAGGDFTRADVTNVYGAITGGTFEGGMELKNGRLHITEKTDWSSGVPGILGKLTYDELVVDASMSFNAGNATLPAKVTLLTGSTIHGGDFSNSTLSMEPNVNFTAGKFQGFEYKDHTMTVTGEVDWSQGDGGLWEALYDVRAVVINADASFDAGENTISAAITNEGSITGGTIDGEICANTGTIKGCAFGPNATVTSNEGIIELSITVDERDRKVNYGADVLEALGPSPTCLWYRVNADGTRSLVKEGETFASLQGETYTSSPLLPKPEIEIDYINETFSVTLAEEDVPEGVDVTDIYVNFRQLGQSEFLYAGMASFPIVLSLSDFDRYWGLKLPSDKEIAMEAYYSFAVTDANGNETVVAYGEMVEWVIPARPYINVNTVQPGYNEMTVTLDTEPYEVYLESVDGSTVIYDADDGAVDGRIHGLTEGTEYIVYFRVPPTEDSFASPQYYLVETFTTLTRTRLSVEAAETSWEWQPGFSLNAEDCFAVQVTLQGEKEMPEKGKFILTATKDGREVPFPLTEPGAYTITASLSADVADDYVLDTTSFTVVIGERRHEIDSRDITVRPIPAQTYTGGPIYPAVSVWHGATQLVMGEDYTVSYQNNVKVGVATIVITGMGDYAGTRLAFFDIVPPQATEEEEKPSGGSGTSGDGDRGETTGEAQQNRLVVDENGQAMPYTYSTVEVLDEETGAVIARKLVIVADPVQDETGAVVYEEDGQPRYEARSLLLSRELLDAIAERGYTHIRFAVKDAALEWPLASMPEDNYTVRLAPMEENEWNEREIAAIEGLPVLSQGYRAQIVTVENGEEIDVTKGILELKALLLAEVVSPVTEDAEVNLLLVPLEEMVESSLSPANWVEATQIEPARYEALLIDSGLFAMVGE